MHRKRQHSSIIPLIGYRTDTHFVCLAGELKRRKRVYVFRVQLVRLVVAIFGV